MLLKFEADSEDLRRILAVAYEHSTGETRELVTELCEQLNNLEVAADTEDAALSSAMRRFGIASRTSKTGWELTGYRPNRYRYPFSATGPQGGQYKLTVEQARLNFGVVATTQPTLVSGA